MTFEEWFNQPVKDGDGVSYPNRFEQLCELYDWDVLGTDTVKDLMKEAWDGRYETLTYKDL